MIPKSASLFALSLALVICVSASAINGPQRTWSGFKNLTLELAVPREKYVQLQPIPLTLTLSNMTKDVLNGHSALDFASGFVQVWIKSSNADWRTIDNLTVEKKLVIVKPREIKPDERITTNQVLSLGLERSFPEPGVYQIKVRLHNNDHSQTIESQPVAVRIDRPEGADLEAYNFIHANANVDLFFTGKQLGRNRRDDQSLETFVTVFGETSYGDDASFVLGERRSFEGDLEAARVQFAKLAKRQDFVFAKRVKDYLEKIRKRQNKN
jgi:hypothetical protein